MRGRAGRVGTEGGARKWVKNGRGVHVQGGEGVCCCEGEERVEKKMRRESGLQ